MRPLGTPSLMAWAYVPISTFRFVEVKLLEEALATDSKLGTSEGFGVFSCSQDPSPSTSRKLRIRQETGLFVGKEKSEWFF
jgi:hypothetical protein